MFWFILINCKEREFLKLSSLFSISCIHTLVASDFIYIVLKTKNKIRRGFHVFKDLSLLFFTERCSAKNLFKRKIKLQKKKDRRLFPLPCLYACLHLTGIRKPG